MITDAVLNFFYRLLRFIIGPLTRASDATLPAGIASAISSAGAYLQNINRFFPVSTLLAILTALAAIEVGIFTYKLVVWVYHQFWGSS